MAIRAAMQAASLRLIGRRPGTFFGASGTFESEIASWVNEVAQDVAKYQDWQALQKIHTITGNGSLEDFALPTDYDRMLTLGKIQDTSGLAWGYYPFASLNDYLRAKESGFGPHPGGWIIYGGKMHFSPAPASGQTAAFPYITRDWARGSDGAPKACFSSDDDDFLLPDRLLTLGLVWRWRENKKLDASGDQEAFIKALDEYGAKDTGARPIIRRQSRFLAGTHPAWPWSLG